MENFSTGVKIQENVDIKDYSTFKIGGKFRYFTAIESTEDLKKAYTIAQNELKVPIFILGGGSNVVFSDGILNVFALKMEIKSFEILNENDDYVYVKAGAGMPWDDLVKESIKNNLSGVEALSIIPGTVGAGPVQNVGAYGVEVKDIIKEVIVYDIKDGVIKNLSNLDCQFGYRDSLFKKEKGRYVILYVIYKLSKKSPSIPNYPDVISYFEQKNISNPNIKDIREAIIFIRNSKLPNFRDMPNVGSFFKNPIVLNSVVDGIKEKFPNIKLFKADDFYTKIPAGWLIENAGLKGKNFGKIGIYEKNALVLVNNGEATFTDLINAKNEIIKIVEEKFGITLKQEPEII